MVWTFKSLIITVVIYTITQYVPNTIYHLFQRNTINSIIASLVTKLYVTFHKYLLIGIICHIYAWISAHLELSVGSFKLACRHHPHYHLPINVWFWLSMGWRASKWHSYALQIAFLDQAEISCILVSLLWWTSPWPLLQRKKNLLQIATCQLWVLSCFWKVPPFQVVLAVEVLQPMISEPLLSESAHLPTAFLLQYFLFCSLDHATCFILIDPTFLLPFTDFQWCLSVILSPSPCKSNFTLSKMATFCWYGSLATIDRGTLS